MFGVNLLIGFVVIAWTTANWYFEVKPFTNNIYYHDYRVAPTGSTLGTWDSICNMFGGIKSLLVNITRFFIYGKWFIIDMVITIFLTSVFSFGQGLMGGFTGMLLSNCVSIMILALMYKEQKRKTKGA